MNNTTKTNSIDEKVWERHRSKIESLYWEHSLSTIDTYMKKYHGFAASKAQYERHLRKWQLRKNLTGSQWGMIIRHIKRNSICLERVEVLFKGHEIPQSRIIQEIARRSSLINTLEHGSDRLPMNITLRPRSSTPNMDIANGLRTSSSLVTSSSSSSLQTEDDLDLVTITSPTINSLGLNKSTCTGLYTPSFSWMQLGKMDSLLLTSSVFQQLVKQTQPSETQFNAIFCPTHHFTAGGTQTKHDTVLPSYMIASLLNNVSLAVHPTSNNAYALIKALPLSAVSQGLKALSIPIQDAFKERVFAISVQNGDLALMLAMLKLKLDPWERIMMDWEFVSQPTYPLTFATAVGHHKIARTLLSQMCQGANQSQLHELFGQIVEGRKLGKNIAHCGEDRHRSRMPETIESMCIVLAAGASPIRKCLNNSDPISIPHLKQLIDSTAGGIMAWLEIGLLDYYLTKPEGWEAPHMLRNRVSAAHDILQCVFNDYRDHLPKGCPRVKEVMRDVLRVVQTELDDSATQTILNAFNLVGYRLVGEEIHEEDISMPGSINDSILEPFDSTDWTAAASLMIAEGPNSAPSIRELEKKLKDAIAEKNLIYSLSAIRKHPALWYLLGSQILKLASSLGNDVNSIIRDMEDRESSGDVGLAVLLEYGQTATLSALLTGHTVWRCALEAVSEKDDFGPLEAMIFQGSPAPFLGDPKPQYRGDAVKGPDEHQLCFRAIAYYAIATNDFKLCKWLLAVGMDAEELFILDLDDGLLCYVRKAPAMYCSFGGGRGNPLDQVKHKLPSLLEVAAQHNNQVWIEFLLAAGVSAIDSMALLRATRNRASDAIIHLLLEAAQVRKSLVERTYGVAALRQAVRSRNFGLIKILCAAVDMNAIEPFPEEYIPVGHPSPDIVSPLGEAIITNDLEIVRILLHHNASPNAFVSLDGLEISEKAQGYMQRVTPLLAAIDMKSLPMVKVLLECGAELHYTCNMGTTRTPLQRAAEMGCLDIVQYLVNQHAIIDTIPIYSGATALQLAAMNGFCGIAEFLLKHEANPNYPPGRGHGRTAFEAAAEQGRIDMMSLLVKWNVNLDLVVGEPPESQYERARRFAENNGFMASKRYVEHIYKQTMGDQEWGSELALDLMSSIG
ncbi:unnamed protein product [Alternaria burnsii]|nr:unnamed protein product [Alternaria burnsii]